MSTAFDSIKQGLQEAMEHARGKETGVKLHRPRSVDVKAMRAKLGMTQEQFAARFGFSTATLRHWERGAAHSMLAAQLWNRCARFGLFEDRH